MNDTAHHEAGHAIIARHFGRNVQSITIKPSEKGQVLCHMTCPLDDLTWDGSRPKSPAESFDPEIAAHLQRLREAGLHPFWGRTLPSHGGE